MVGIGHKTVAGQRLGPTFHTSHFIDLFFSSIDLNYVAIRAAGWYLSPQISDVPGCLQLVRYINDDDHCPVQFSLSDCSENRRRIVLVSAGCFGLQSSLESYLIRVASACKRKTRRMRYERSPLLIRTQSNEFNPAVGLCGDLRIWHEVSRLHMA